MKKESSCLKFVAYGRRKKGRKEGSSAVRTKKQKNARRCRWRTDEERNFVSRTDPDDDDVDVASFSALDVVEQDDEERKERKGQKEGRWRHASSVTRTRA